MDPFTESLDLPLGQTSKVMLAVLKKSALEEWSKLELYRASYLGEVHYSRITPEILFVETRADNDRIRSILKIASFSISRIVGYNNELFRIADFRVYHRSQRYWRIDERQGFLFFKAQAQ